MTPVRVRVTDLPGNRRQVTIGCSCATISRTVTAWEPLDEVVAALRAQHQAEARVCQHPWMPVVAR